jgi:hypothetical protein
VEAWEPDLHFFNPIELKRKNGDRIGDYYLWSVGQDIDCIFTEGHEGIWTREADGTISRFSFHDLVKRAEFMAKHPKRHNEIYGLTEPKPDIKISAPAVAGRHLWMGGVLGMEGRGGEYCFMSDEMYVAYKKEKFQGLEFQCRAAEVDREWVAEENMGQIFSKWQIRNEKIDKNWPKIPNRRGG